MIRFGLIGCGTHAGWAVLPALRTAANCRLAAVADIVPAHLDSVTDEGVGRYLDYREMLRQEKLDAVYVATPCDVHCEPTVAALEAGAHVLCEKPMGMNAAECRRMLAAAEKARRLLAIDFESRFHTETQIIRRWIDEGHLGAIHAVHIDEFWDGHKLTGEIGARRHRFLERTGCLDCGIHMLDLARFYVGGGEWRDVHALGAWFGEDAAFPPHIAVQGRLTSGALVTLNASFAYLAAVPQRSFVHYITIAGATGAIECQQTADSQTAFRIISPTLTESHTVGASDHGPVITKVIESFAESIEAGRFVSPSLATGLDGLMAQEIVDEANRQACQVGDASVPRD